MKSLFSYLVDHIGLEQIIDPLTKEDALWSIIDMYTKDSHFFIASQYSPSNSIDSADIARYLSN